MPEQTAQVQIYTLSDIKDWRVYKGGVSRELWEKYTSTLYDFENWVQIGDVEFGRAAEDMKRHGNQIVVGHENPFLIKGDSYLSPRQSFLYLFNNSLVTLHPKSEGYVATPESPHFRESNLLDHVNLAIFSSTRELLEGTADSFHLPLGRNK